jgi:aminoglycoside phosphotransferase (APT) family kinase protein
VVNDQERRETVARVAGSLLGAAVTELPTAPAQGLGNETWRVTLGDRRVIVRVAGFDADLGKLRAAWQAHGLAWSAGVPTGEPICMVEQCAELGGRALRLVGFVDGHAPAGSFAAPEDRRRFLRSLGAALARLHRVRLPGFSSRVDGSAPAFDEWPGYVAFRIEGVRARALRSGAFDEHELDRLFGPLPALAAAVSPSVRPALTHRDLHPGNLVADADGTLRAVVDWDGSEAWDPLVDFVKLRWQMLDDHPDAADDLWQGYGGRPEHVEERLAVLDVLELVNAVANARLDRDARYEAANRHYLARATG